MPTLRCPYNSFLSASPHQYTLHRLRTPRLRVASTMPNAIQEEVDKLATELSKVRQLAESSARLGLHVQQSFSDEVGNT